jgi:hypothetical protein
MKSFGHMRPIRNDDGQITGSKLSPVKARTLDTLGRAYGIDHDKRLVVSLEAQDIIALRPERTTRTLRIAAKDLYAHILRIEANAGQLAKARAKKEAKAIRLASQRQARAEARLLRN